MKLLAATVLLALFVGCSGEPSEAPQPVIDGSTPDRVVETLWAHGWWAARLDWDQSNARAEPQLLAYTADVRRRMAEQRAQVIAKAETGPKKRIDKVTIESETRAVVMATEPDYSGELEKITYILSRVDNSWQIAERHKVCWKCKGSGKETNYDAVFEGLRSGRPAGPTEETCKSCAGKGWLDTLE